MAKDKGNGVTKPMIDMQKKTNMMESAAEDGKEEQADDPVGHTMGSILKRKRIKMMKGKYNERV